MDRLISAYTSSPLLFWILSAFLAHFLGTSLLWMTKPESRLPSSYLRWMVEIARFLFFLGIPYLVLGGWPRNQFQGLLALEDLGLVGLSAHWPVTRWLGAAGTGLGLGLIALLTLALAWANANRGTGAHLHFPPRTWWAVLVDGLYLQVHWAFYRAAIAGLLDDIYVGTFGGLGVAYLEWGLNPLWRQGWQRGPQATEQWLRAALALVAAILFLLTRNLWVCLGVHWLLELILRRMGRTRATVHADAQILESPSFPQTTEST